MEEAGWIWVRTRGLASRLVHHHTECPFDHVGVYWRQDGVGPHGFLLVGALTRRPWACDDGTEGTGGVRDATPATVESTLLFHPDVLQVNVMPFFRPVIRDVLVWTTGFVQHVLGMPSLNLTAFLARPEPLMHLLPPLPETLTFIPHCAFPGINLLMREPDMGVTLEGDGSVLLELGQGLFDRVVTLEPVTSATGCMWCQSYRGILDELDRTGNVRSEYIQHSLLARLGSKPEWVDASLALVPRDMREGWSTFLASLRDQDPDVVLPTSLLNDTAALFGIAPVVVTHPYAVTLTPSAPVEYPPPAEPLRTLRRIPLFGTDLASLDRTQLEELERHLGHPTAVADPATSLLRERVHQRLYRIDESNTK